MFPPKQFLFTHFFHQIVKYLTNCGQFASFKTVFFHKNAPIKSYFGTRKQRIQNYLKDLGKKKKLLQTLQTISISKLNIKVIAVRRSLIF